MPYALNPALSGFDVANLLYISVLGSAASYGVFFYNAAKGNLTALSSLTFLTPMFAAGAGYLVLGETLTPLQVRIQFKSREMAVAWWELCVIMAFWRG